MAYTYATFLAEFAAMLEYDTDDAIFLAMLPGAIRYAEERIYREIDLAAEVKRDSTGALIAGNRAFTLPTGQGNFRVVKGVNVITPAGTAASAGKRNPLVAVSRDGLDALWPDDAANQGLPQLYAVLDNNTILVGPSPDAAYTVEVVGVIRPEALSTTNASTYLTATYPDLFFAAAMIHGAAFKRNFGAQSEDPKMALSWEAQYQTLKASALAEEGRRETDS